MFTRIRPYEAIARAFFNALERHGYHNHNVYVYAG